MCKGKPSYYSNVDSIDWAPSINLRKDYSSRYERRQKYNKHRDDPVKYDKHFNPLDLSNKNELQEDTEAAPESINHQPALSLELKSLKEEIIRLQSQLHALNEDYVS
ncbi:hypothetical protein OUZ56_029789 [Daphnia magna]|uniref:Uncharacterized protein n=1 Tax=Daphnia magna TaxID=35525 RepID=A0ABR0B7U6_9CRUS|nr:hypothetical protein OUZ56_029789 [Daphnia magna]